MAEQVVVMTTADGAGATVAVDMVGSQAYQLMKLADGTVDSSTPIPATSGVPAGGAFGLVVAIKPGASVTIAAGAVQISGITPVVTQASVSVTGLPVWFKNDASVNVGNGTTNISGSVGIVGGTAIAFRYSTAVAGTVLTTPVVTVGVDLTTVATSAYVVPGGKVLVLEAINGYIANTVAVMARGAFQIIASLAYSAAVGPVYGALNLAPPVTVAGARGVGGVQLNGMQFSAGVTVQFPIFVTGTSSQPCEFIVIGRLLP